MFRLSLCADGVLQYLDRCNDPDDCLAFCLRPSVHSDNNVCDQGIPFLHVLSSQSPDLPDPKRIPGEKKLTTLTIAKG